MDSDLIDSIPSPSYVMEDELLLKNLQLLRSVQDRTGVKILLALKGFAFWNVFQEVINYLSGASASSLHESKLIREEMGVKAHTYCPAFLPSDMKEIMNNSSHIIFNSLNQFERFSEQAKRASCSIGLRVNPEYSEIETALYNPGTKGGRLGIPRNQLGEDLPEQVDGLHFHTLCENDSYVLERTLGEVENKFASFFKRLKWLNLGGGHLITSKSYDVEHLVDVLNAFKRRHPHLDLYMEPGEAIGWETGFLLSTIQDIVLSGEVQTAMLDVSFTTHMPDTLEMPYRPEVRGASSDGKGKYQYRLGGISCLAGDVLEEYGFDKELHIGDKIILEDMIHYTMVKNNTFNGVNLPSICRITRDRELIIVKQFGYEDFKNRLS